MDGRAVRALLDDLGQRADLHGVQTLNSNERTVLVPWAALGSIGNGGFRYWFEGYHDLREAADGFRALGHAAVADACERAQQAFPGGVAPKDAKERHRLLRTIDWRRLSNDEDVVLALKFDDLAKSIGAYVTQHADSFPGLRAAMAHGSS